MTYPTLILRSLRFHWRAHLGVLLGAIIGIAALVGALVVGDSVRESLLDMARKRLGWVDAAMVTPDRFFTQHSLENKVSLRIWRSKFPGQETTVLMLPGIASRQDGTARANHVNILGVTPTFWHNDPSLNRTGNPLFDAMFGSAPNAVILNEALANQLHAKVGDDVVLRVQKPNLLSIDVPITPQNDSSSALRLKVCRIVSPTEMGEFSLQPSQMPPMNAFVRIRDLEVAANLPGKANIMLGGKLPMLRTTSWPKWWHESISRVRNWLRIPDERIRMTNASPAIIAALYNQMFPETCTLADYDLEVKKLTNTIELRTSRIFLDPPAVRAAQSLSNVNQTVFVDWNNEFAFAGQTDPNNASRTTRPNEAFGIRPFSKCHPLLTYVVNQFRSGTNTVPYSMVTAAGSPWTPPDMRDDEILVNQWLADDMALKPGDTLDLTYFLPESAANLLEATNRFRVRAIVPLFGLYADRTLMPEFPGIAKAESTHNWEAGFPLVHKIRDKDEDYWKQYRGTPKAFVTLAAGQKMWGSRFGNLTAIRWPAPAFPDASKSLQSELERNLLQRLNPADFGLRFEPVRDRMLAAATQAQDFGQLFLGFSFFLILAALILMGLLFQFGLEQRMTEIGTLLALGWTPKQVRRLFLGEAALLAFLGGLGGIIGGTYYARAMLYGLTTIWREAVQTSSLTYHFQPTTLLVGLCASVIVSILTIACVLRKQARRPARELLTEGAVESQTRYPDRANGASTHQPRATPWERVPDPSLALKGRDSQSKIFDIKSKISFPLWLAISATLLALSLVLWALASGHATNAGIFFGSGSLLLIAGFAFASSFLKKLGHSISQHALSIASLGLRGCTRRRTRSLATIGLLACGSFMIVAVGANRLDAERDAQKRNSGTGGFALIGESTLPVVHDLNTERGQDFFSLDTSAMKDVQVVPFRVRAGDEASCLNLNRAQRPRALGVAPEALAKRQAFTFAQVMKGHSATDGWNLLNARLNDEVPAIGDQNSIQWAMHKKVGDTIEYVDERGKPFIIRIVASLATSVLQGSLLISEEHFRARFPGESGYRMFLVDTPTNRVTAVSETLTSALQDVGLELTPAPRRLAAFNAVQNTYLNTFQILGGIGLLLGSAGLGIVVLRNVLERRGELALLQAVGFRRRALRWLVLSEHAGLLWFGLGIGMLAALVAILPVLLSPGAKIHYLALGATLAAVMLSGFIWTVLATWSALRGKLLAALRNE